MTILNAAVVGPGGLVSEIEKPDGEDWALHVLIVCQEDGDLLLHANNYIVNTHIWDEPRPEKFDIEAYLQDYVTEPDDSGWRLTSLCIAGMKMDPSVKYIVDNGKVQWTWNEENGNLDIQLQHNGPVDLVLSREILY